MSGQWKSIRGPLRVDTETRIDGIHLSIGLRLEGKKEQTEKVYGTSGKSGWCSMSVGNIPVRKKVLRQSDKGDEFQSDRQGGE